MEAASFKLIHDEVTIKIQSNFPFLNDVNTNILSALKKDGKYKVKSIVSENVFEAFINNWLTGKTPIICEDNIMEYTKLSEEFDRMKNLIQIYQKKSKNNKNLPLLAKINNNKNLYTKKEARYHENEKNYQIIIKKLLINSKIDTFSRFLEIKEDLLESCYSADIKKIDRLTKKMIKFGQLSIVLNDEDKTADIIDGMSSQDDVYIPRSVEYKSQEYVINKISVDIFKHSMVFTKSSINFDPDSELKVIGNGAFFGCNLTSLFIPASIEKIKKGWIYGLDQLTDIEVDPKNKNFVYFDNKYILEKSDKKSDIFDVLIFARRDIETAIIPSFVKVIKYRSFDNCTKLKDVIFDVNSNLEKIENCAFQFSSVENISLPSSCILDYNWCYEINNLISVKIMPCDQQNIAFFENKFIFQKSDIYSDDFDVLVYALRNFETAEIPFFIKKIGPCAFNKCKQLKNVSFALNSQLEIISKNAFSYTSIEEITIPQHVKIIDEYSFFKCKHLKQVKFDENSELEIINESAFEETSIESISIPSKVKKIQSEAFTHCDNLKNVIFQENSRLENISYHAFYSCPIEQIFLPSGVKKLGCKWCKKWPRITISSSNPYISIYNDMFILGKKNPSSDVFDVILSAHQDIEKVTIPSFIVEISRNSFEKCKKLTYVEFEPDSKLKRIEYLAFSSTSIREISIPSSVSIIRNHAFSNCKNLKKFTFPDNPEYNVINEYMFSNSSIEFISIPSHVKTIGQSAFSNCVHLKKIDIPKNSKLCSIGKNAFLCCSSLEEIYIPSNVVEIKNSTFMRCSKLKNVHFAENSKVRVFAKNSFASTAFRSMAIPPSVVYIGEFAFMTNENVKILEIPEYSKLHSINCDVFGCVFKYSPWNLAIMMPKNHRKILSYDSNTLKEKEYKPKKRDFV